MTKKLNDFDICNTIRNVNSQASYSIVFELISTRLNSFFSTFICPSHTVKNLLPQFFLFGFADFWLKNIGKKVARKMLMKLTPKLKSENKTESKCQMIKDVSKSLHVPTRLFVERQMVNR